MHFGEETDMKPSCLLGIAPDEPSWGLADGPAVGMLVSGRDSQEGDGRWPLTLALQS